MYHSKSLGQSGYFILQAHVLGYFNELPAGYPCLRSVVDSADSSGQSVVFEPLSDEISLQDCDGFKAQMYFAPN
jgi:hypothetical protein